MIQLDGVEGFAGGAVGLAGEIDGGIGLQGKDAELQLATACGLATETVEEGTSVVEIVGYEAAVGIEAGTVATVGDG